MNRRILLILGVIFAALAVITYLQSRPKPLTEADIPAGVQYNSFVGRDLNMTVLDIQAIRLRDPQTEAVFVISRDENGNWTAPGSEGSLDTDAASNIAKAVVAMAYTITVDLTDDTDLTQYGFQPNGILSIEIVLADGNGHVLAVGGLTPDQLAFYVLIDDKPQVYLMGRGAVDYLISALTQPPLT